MKQYNESKTPESERDLWRTPPEVIEALCDRFGFDKFDIDLCADAENSIAEDWIGLDSQSCDIYAPGVAWINPPFSRKILIAEAIDELGMGRHEAVFALIPDKPETKIFRELEERATYVCRFNKRINFLRQSGERVSGVPFASVVFVFHRVFVPGMCQQVRLEI